MVHESTHYHPRLVHGVRRFHGVYMCVRVPAAFTTCVRVPCVSLLAHLPCIIAQFVEEKPGQVCHGSRHPAMLDEVYL